MKEPRGPEEGTGGPKRLPSLSLLPSHAANKGPRFISSMMKEGQIRMRKQSLPVFQYGNYVWRNERARGSNGHIFCEYTYPAANLQKKKTKLARPYVAIYQVASYPASSFKGRKWHGKNKHELNNACEDISTEVTPSLMSQQNTIYLRKKQWTTIKSRKMRRRSLLRRNVPCVTESSPFLPIFFSWNSCRSTLCL